MASKGDIAARGIAAHLPIMASLLDPTARGRVILVGAGPGSPDLLTVRAVDALARADVIVHDGLIDPAVLDLAPAGAQRISVAKSRARHTLPQEAINALIVAHVKTGAIVVRLKGRRSVRVRPRRRGGRGGARRRAAGRGDPRRVRCARLRGRGDAAAHPPRLVVGGQLRRRPVQGPVRAGLVGPCRQGADAGDLHGRRHCRGHCRQTDARRGRSRHAGGRCSSAGRSRGRGRCAPWLADLGPMVAREQVQSPAIIVVGEVVELSDAEDKLAKWARIAELTA